MSEQIKLNWSDFKSTVASKNLDIQFFEDIAKYSIFALDSNIAYKIILWKSGHEPVNSDTASIASDRSDFENNYKSSANKRLSTKETSDNFIRATQEPREGDAINFYSPNFCDRSTWYVNSTRITGLELKKTDNKTFIFDDPSNLEPEKSPPWIDLYHGKIFKENSILAANPQYNFELDLSLDGGNTWTRQEMNSLGESDGFYDVDFRNGIVNLNEDTASHAKVRVNCAKAPSTMQWSMFPSSGKRLKLIYAEIQMSIDIEMCTDIIYETWAYNPYWTPTNGQPLKIMVNELRYKSMSDLFYESTGVYAKIPSLGGTGARGYGNKDVIIFPFRYNTARDMLSSQGVEVIIKTEKEHIGTFATTTLYCLQEDE